MRDVAKTRMDHEPNMRRGRRRQRGRMMYAVVVLLLTFAAIATLSMTVLFNIQKIEVTGDAKMYSAEEIAAATGISAGDNMVRLNLDAAEERALARLLYVEEITITRQFPDTLLINVQKCTPTYNVVYEEGTLIVSEFGKILQNSMDREEGLVTIQGYAPYEPSAGSWMTSEDAQDTRIMAEFMNIISNMELEVPIVSVDMSEAHSVIVNFDNRIEFDMGKADDIEYKITFAQHIISRQPADKEGYLTMIGTNQCSFRNKSDVEASRQNQQAATAPSTEGTEGEMTETAAAE